MKKILLPLLGTLFASSAYAQMPNFNATCPGEILVSSNGGYVFIGGKEAKVKKISDSAFDAKGHDVTISVMAEPGQDLSVMYTGKHGANGICQVTEGGAPASAASDKVSNQDMSRYCAGEASAKFKQRPANITTLPPEKDQGMYSVYGQFPPSGANPTIFICTFDSSGKLVGVDKQ